MSALFAKRLKWIVGPSIVGIFLICTLAAQNPGGAEDAKAKKPDPVAALLATTDPAYGYLGTQEAIFVDGTTHTAAGWLLCLNYATGQQELVLALLTLEGPGNVGGYQGWVYKTNLDPSKYTTTDLFLSDQPFWFNNLYPVFGKTAAGAWILKDYCTKTHVAGTGADSSIVNFKPSAF